MERRKDQRHGLRYEITLRCRRSARVLSGLVTRDVSASGVRLRTAAPHALRTGDRVEVQLVGRAPLADGGETLVFATDATVVRAGRHGAALRFEAPLAY